MEGILCCVVFQNGLGLTIKTVNSDSPWASIWEGLLSEGYLHLKIGGLIFRRAYFWEGLLSEFYGILLSRAKMLLKSGIRLSKKLIDTQTQQ